MNLVKAFLSFLTLTTLVLTSVNASAQSSKNELRKRPRLVTKKIEIQPPVEPDYAFSTELEVVRSTSLYDLKNGAKYDGMDYGAGFKFKMPAGTLSTEISVTQTLSPTEGDTTVLNDSHLGYSFPPAKLMINPQSVNIVLAPSAKAIIPLSKKSIDVEEMQTVLIAGLGLQIQAGEQTALNGLSLGLALTVGQSFYKNETDVNGKILNKNSSNQAISLNYSYKSFSLEVAYANLVRWPYAGETKYGFEFSQKASFKFTKNWAVMIGHTNKGASLKPNGYDSNVAIVDEDNSVIFIGMSLGFGGAL